jgi:hypothetical protein
MGCLTESSDTTQNPKIIVETPSQPIETKKLPKFLCLYLKSRKKPKIHMGITGLRGRQKQKDSKQITKFAGRRRGGPLVLLQKLLS